VIIETTASTYPAALVATEAAGHPIVSREGGVHGTLMAVPDRPTADRIRRALRDGGHVARYARHGIFRRIRKDT
jgi:hypothetical protein